MQHVSPYGEISAHDQVWNKGIAYAKTIYLALLYRQWLKWFCEAGAHLTKPGWSKPHTHSNPTNLALFRRKIALYRFNQGAHTIAGGLKWEHGGLSPPPLTLTTVYRFTITITSDVNKTKFLRPRPLLTKLSIYTCCRSTALRLSA